jgi:dCTP deaminase
MIINGSQLLALEPIKNMEECKRVAHGTSYGLTEAGYDIRLKQDIRFRFVEYDRGYPPTPYLMVDSERIYGRFCLASAIEEFQMPENLVGIVHDKSTLARKGLSVFNTVIEPGWKGFLTLELVFHGSEGVHIPAGSGIAQVLFHELAIPAHYSGKYQNQADRPVEAIMEVTH